MLPDSAIATHIQCGRTKSTSIVKDVLAKRGQKDIANELRNRYFSTDVSCTKALVIVVRFFDHRINLIKDKFLAHLKLTSSTADDIYIILLLII